MSTPRNTSHRGIDLPFPAPPPIWCYSHHAMVSGVLSLQESLRPFIFNHYINLRSPPSLPYNYPGGYNIVSFEPTVNMIDLNRCGFMDFKSDKYMAPSAATEAVAGHLEEGWYVVAMADVFFIPEAREFHRTSLKRSLLISGLSEDRQIFTCSTYCRNGVFQKTLLSRQALGEAMCSQLIEQDPRLKIEDPIQCYRLRPGAKAAPVSWNSISFQLADYLAGRDTSRSHMNDAPYCTKEPPDHLKYGIACLEVAGTQLAQTMRDGKVADPRVTRLLLEHSTLMHRRFGSLSQAEIPGLAKITEGLLGLTNLTMKLHLMAVSQSTRPTACPATAADAKTFVDRVAIEQRGLFPKIIDLISNNMKLGLLSA